MRRILTFFLTASLILGWLHPLGYADDTPAIRVTVPTYLETVVSIPNRPVLVEGRPAVITGTVAWQNGAPVDGGLLLGILSLPLAPGDEFARNTDPVVWAFTDANGSFTMTLAVPVMLIPEEAELPVVLVISVLTFLSTPEAPSLSVIGWARHEEPMVVTR